MAWARLLSKMLLLGKKLKYWLMSDLVRGWSWSRFKLRRAREPTR